MKIGYAGDFVPLLPAMLAGATMDPGEGSAQPAEPHHIPIDLLPSTSLPPHSPHQSLPHLPHQSPPHSPHQSTPHSPYQSPPYSPPHYSPPRSYEASLPEGNQQESAEDINATYRMMDIIPNYSGKGIKRKTQKVVISESDGVKTERVFSKVKSTDKGKRYRRRARSVAKNINTGLDDEEEINTSREEINIGIKEATHKTKEQIRQEEAGLEEAIKLQAQMDEEVAKQIHLDEMVAKRMAEEEALSKQQKKRKAQVQFEAQYYTEEDWDAIRAKLEANAELTKDVLGKDLPEQDFAKRIYKGKIEKIWRKLQTKTSKKTKDESDKYARAHILVLRIEKARELPRVCVQFGCTLEFVSNKLQEGSQFCRGFGGIGGILSYQLEIRSFDELSDDELYVFTQCFNIVALEVSKGANSLQAEDHNLWDVIVNGDLEEKPTPTTGETFAPPAPKTAKQLAARRNQERVKSILLLAIPDEYLLKFHNIADAKSLWEAIKSRFSGN
ncbi:ribonuclease H-like domain-containing protein, partial [Tanacetum coccineum]